MTGSTTKVTGWRAAPPPDGKLQVALKSLAVKTWRQPLADQEIRFGVSTLERWYYAAKSALDPVAALRNRLRDDVGRFPTLSELRLLASARFDSQPLLCVGLLL